MKIDIDDLTLILMFLLDIQIDNPNYLKFSKLYPMVYDHLNQSDFFHIDLLLIKVRLSNQIKKIFFKKFFSRKIRTSVEHFSAAMCNGVRFV